MTGNLRDGQHYLIGDFLPFHERRRFVVCGLWLRRKEAPFVVVYQVVFHLAEGQQVQAGLFAEPLIRACQHVVGRDCRRFAGLVIKSAVNTQRILGERVRERRLINRYDIKVACGLVYHALEQAGAVNPLALRQQSFNVIPAVDRQFEFLQTAVAGRIAKADIRYPAPLDDVQQILPPPLLRQFAQFPHKGIRVHAQ